MLMNKSDMGKRTVTSSRSPAERHISASPLQDGLRFDSFDGVQDRKLGAVACSDSVVVFPWSQT